MAPAVREGGNEGRPVRPAARVALAAAALAAAGLLWLGAARGDVPRGPVYAQAGLPAGAVWAVDPQDPGPNLPPAGRSLFDFLTTVQEGEARVQRVPFPFQALLAAIEERLGRRPGEPSPLKGVLIPLGRSLQRNSGAPEFFRYPRAVVAVDAEGASGEALARDRLYLGYHEKAEIIEVISYNEAAGRFEFQIVRDYRPGGRARVVYANRAVCTACHQGGGPIFARQLWDETNANPEVARLLAAEERDFYGLAVDQGVDVPYAIDAATDRANRLAVYQLLWREGCGGGESGRAVRCRAAAFTAALQHLLSGGAHDGAAEGFREAFLATARRAWEVRWPQGLAIPDPDILNRDPLAVRGAAPVAVSVPAALAPEEALRLQGLVRRSHVPALFEPLNPRPPLEVWTAEGVEGKGPERLVAGLAELLAAADARRLDGRLFAEGSRPDRPRERHAAPCEVAVQRREAGAERVKLRCTAPEAGGLTLEGRVYLDGSRVTGGTIERLEAAGYALRDLEVVGGKIAGAAGRREADVEVVRKLSGLHARRASGDALERVRLSWRDAEAKGEATAIFLNDFAAVRSAVEELAGRTTAGRLDAFSSRPFRRAAALGALFAELGLEPPSCCLDDSGMPPAVVEELGTAGPDDFPEPAVKALYQYCARCHATPEVSPPNFLYGDPAKVRTNLARCAERIFFRLDVWRLPAGTWPKTPMPPVHALESLGRTPESWPGDPALALLRQHAAGLLRAETGAEPRLEGLEARGYENLRSCLPPETGVLAR